METTLNPKGLKRIRSMIQRMFCRQYHHIHAHESRRVYNALPHIHGPCQVARDAISSTRAIPARGHEAATSINLRWRW